MRPRENKAQFLNGLSKLVDQIPEGARLRALFASLTEPADCREVAERCLGHSVTIPRKN